MLVVVSEVLVVERPHPKIGILRMNSIERMNALDDDFVHKIHQALAAIADDASQRVVIITGTGNAFCAEMDIESAMKRSGAQRSVVARLKRRESLDIAQSIMVNSPFGVTQTNKKNHVAQSERSEFRCCARS